MPGGHDQLFKDLIRTFPGDFLRLGAPGVARRLDWGTLELQPTEGFLDLPRGAARRLDLVARAGVLADPEGPVLLHVEVELRYRATVPARLWRYNRLLHLRHDLPVHTFVLYLKGGPAGVRDLEYREVSLDRELALFRYTAFGLSGAPAEEYLARPEPLAWALAALMRPVSHTRLEQRLACLRRVATARSLTEAERFLLFNCVATYLELDGRAGDEYQALLQESEDEEVRAMAMTWAEKVEEKARQQGIQQGMQEGMKTLLLRQLRQRFQSLPPATAQRISAITSSQELERLADRLLSARSLEELGLA